MLNYNLTAFSSFFYFSIFFVLLHLSLNYLCTLTRCSCSTFFFCFSIFHLKYLVSLSIFTNFLHLLFIYFLTLVSLYFQFPLPLYTFSSYVFTLGNLYLRLLLIYSTSIHFSLYFLNTFSHGIITLHFPTSVYLSTFSY